MILLPMMTSVSLVVGLSVALVFTGVKMQPGIGIIAAILLIPAVMWIRDNALEDRNPCIIRG